MLKKKDGDALSALKPESSFACSLAGCAVPAWSPCCFLSCVFVAVSRASACCALRGMPKTSSSAKVDCAAVVASRRSFDRSASPIPSFRKRSDSSCRSGPSNPRRSANHPPSASIGLIRTTSVRARATARPAPVCGRRPARRPAAPARTEKTLRGAGARGCRALPSSRASSSAEL